MEDIFILEWPENYKENVKLFEDKWHETSNILVDNTRRPLLLYNKIIDAYHFLGSVAYETCLPFCIFITVYSLIILA